MPMSLKFYLAGPEVFLPDALDIAAAKKRICAVHGLEGVFPFDTPPQAPPAEKAVLTPLRGGAARRRAWLGSPA